MRRAPQTWDTDYEWKAVLLLGLGFGLVGLDRWIIAPLFPCMAANDVAPGCGAPGLGLNYQAIGNLVAVIGIVWVPLRIGCRPVSSAERLAVHWGSTLKFNSLNPSAASPSIRGVGAPRSTPPP